MKQFLNNLVNLPVAVAGLALGTAGLGGVLAIEVHPAFRYICAAIAIMLLVMILMKKLKHPKVILSEISHPVMGSFIPAFDMTLMIIADILTNFSLISGQILWLIAIALHAIFAISFFYHRAKDFDINHMLPSWFVPPVGIVVACVTSTHMGFPELTHTIFYIGFILYLIMLPIMMYRLIFGDAIKDPQLPAFAVLGAPASLCLAGYLTGFAIPNPIIVDFLLAIALMMTFLVYLSCFRINFFRISFIPIYASYTFPLSIGATALVKYSRYVGLDTPEGQFWNYLALFEMCIATIAVVLILTYMLKFIMRNVFFAHKHN